MPLTFRALSLVLLLLPFPPSLLGADGAGMLVRQLQTLSESEGFPIKGAGRLHDGPARAASGTPTQQVKSLLRGHDYVLVHTPAGRIERLIIIGEKQQAPPLPAPGAPDNVIKTQRKGDHHLVPVELVGPNGVRKSVSLMLDTGASLVVLPLSFAVDLGLNPVAFQSRELQTAKGKLSALIGTLSQLQIGSDSLTDVQAAFVEDSLLGDNPLLGMNVIGRYVFILDDDNNELTLLPEEK